MRLGEGGRRDIARLSIARPRDFANEYIRPWAAAADLEPEPAKGFSWELIRKGSELGFRTLSVPPELGGEGVDVLVGGIAGAFDQCLKLSYILTAVAENRVLGRVAILPGI